MPSFERFERELTARGLGKEGIVIDVRFNGGGWTTDYLMTILNYKQHAYTIPRGAAKDLKKESKKFRDYYPLGERLPFAAWTKPSIALCNQNSYSNAEIFSHAYKNLGIGTLVGMPTFGAVISTGARGLIDGSFVRMPGRGWYVKADDKNMDFYPAVPDIIVENAPDAKAKGNDEQLKKAVEELLKQIDNK
jgi:C-terminal processing protease CtpA/Prc